MARIRMLQHELFSFIEMNAFKVEGHAVYIQTVELGYTPNLAAAAANVKFTERCRKARERAAAHCSTCMR
jgi:hypothetical protein